MTIKKAKNEVFLVDAIMELYGCDPTQLEDVDSIMRILSEAVRLAGMHVVGVKQHKFNPVGFTGVVLLSQSHLAIHTYPEFGYAIIDILACNPKDMLSAYTYLTRTIRHNKVQSKSRTIRRSFDKRQFFQGRCENVAE